jgi:hypothetical protein
MIDMIMTAAAYVTAVIDEAIVAAGRTLRVTTKASGRPAARCLLYKLQRDHLHLWKIAPDLVGVAGFEPTTSSSIKRFGSVV